MRKKKEKKMEGEYRLITSKERFKHINKVGMELEGGWEKRPDAYTVHTDSSVGCRGAIKGESRTDPKISFDGVFQEIASKYPDDVDGSCGLHVHISLKPGYYPILMEEEFNKYFLYRMGILAKYIRNSGSKTDYANFLSRFGDKNSFCRREFNPEGQIAGTCERRTMLNFCSYNKHKTLECRLFPMFERVSNAKMAVYEYIDTVETYLAKHGLDTEAREVVVFDEDEEMVMEASCA